jgi:hypothetical protein
MSRLLLAAVLLGAGCTVHQVVVHRAPPDERPENRDPKPGPGYFWMKGRWTYNPSIDDYAWQPGHWEREQQNRVWIPGYWAPKDDGWLWHEATWEETGR